MLGSRLLTGIAQAEAAGAISGKVPIVTVDKSVGLGTPNRHFVVMRLADWLDFIE